MLGIGFWEMLVIAGLILIAVGPDRLPSMIKTVSKFYRQFRRTAEDLRASTGIDDLLRDEELKELAELRKQKIALLASQPKPLAKVVDKPLPSGKPVPAPTPPKTAPTSTPDGTTQPATAIEGKARLAEDPGHAMIGAALPRTRAGEAVKSPPARGLLSDKERALEVPPEGVDVFEALRREPEMSEEELRLRKARVTSKNTGRPVEEILAEDAARAASAAGAT
ncbi:MAG: twin-arginine translocase TatA/TatE family subunit [Deltaproteobacteria bacterium]|nr:twin-arginine translocase TatA/TatE family subunit [Deltaproteobacteria bacterium]